MRAAERNIKACFVLLIATCVGITSAVAQQVTAPTGDLAKIDIVEHLGQKIPADLAFTDENGAPVTLSSYLGHDKPVILMLGYYECPMLCNLVFNAVADGVKGLEWTPGNQFQMLTVSIKPQETHELALAKKQNYIKYLGKPEAAGGWSFLVGDGSQSAALADALGFKYVFNKSTGEYGHAAAIYILTDDGTISRYLYGIEFKSRDLKFALLEASQGKIGSTLDRLLLYCYHYDPASKGYVFMAQNIMKIGGGLTVLGVAAFLTILWRNDRARSARLALANTSTVNQVRG